MVTRKQLAMFLAGIASLIFVVSVGVALAGDYSVDTKTKDGIGTYLVDGKGMTLYYFEKDTPGKSACVGSPCADLWPVFYTETVTVPTGLDGTKFGTITRTDKRKQTTYKDMPLYYFVKDTAPGETSGEGFKGIWHVAKP